MFASTSCESQDAPVLVNGGGAPSTPHTGPFCSFCNDYPTTTAEQATTTIATLEDTTTTMMMTQAQCVTEDQPCCESEDGTCLVLGTDGAGYPRCCSGECDYGKSGNSSTGGKCKCSKGDGMLSKCCNDNDCCGDSTCRNASTNCGKDGSVGDGECFKPPKSTKGPKRRFRNLCKHNPSKLSKGLRTG